MYKRLISWLLALAMLLQIVVPQTTLAKVDVKPHNDNLVKVGQIGANSYDGKVMNALNRFVAKNRKTKVVKSGTTLFSPGPYFGDDNEPNDQDKPKYYGNITVDFKLNGLDGKPFKWNDVFGVDENGKSKPAQIIFMQIDDDTGDETGVQFVLKVTEDGKYTWSDGSGNPTKLPLFSKKCVPYSYEAKMDEDVADKVKLLTARMTDTEGNTTFLPENSEGEIIANITLALEYQQVASTKFKSEWHTEVLESDRPQIKGTIIGQDNGVNTAPLNFDLPKNDKDIKIIRDLDEELDPNLMLAKFLFVTPKVDVKTDTPGLTFDTTKKTVKSDDRLYRYAFEYDVIEGGKLTMTEILPVTFDANGGKFASITDPNAEQKIVKEADYDGALMDKVERPTKPGMAFKGWSLTKGGAVATDDDFANIKSKKTFYAVWSDEDIQAEELEVKESYRIDKSKQTYHNDFVPTFEELKAQVKVKDDSGNFVELPADVKFSIVGDKDKKTGNINEYDKESVDLKNFLYDKVKENRVDEVSRTETVKAKLTYADGTTREVDIPIKVLKNIYMGSEKGNKYSHIPENYVKVTIDPTSKAHDPQKTYYYVNPEANVIVPVTSPVGNNDNKFSKWTMKADSNTGDVADYIPGKRYQFTEASTITAQYGAGIIKIAYVDENGEEIDHKYQLVGTAYPSEKSGGLGTLAREQDFPKTGPKFEGYVAGDRAEIKNEKYQNPATDTIKYPYSKKVTTKEPTNKNSYFPVIFDANGGEFKSDAVTQKTVYVYFDGNNATVEKVTFKEVKDEVEKAFGIPTKDLPAFKEWQNAKTNGKKPVDDYEIQFKGWDWDADPDNGYVPETFYAHYEQTSALVKYLDLNGDPITDDFKFISTEAGKDVDGEGNKLTNATKYPEEKLGPNETPIPSDVFTLNNAPTFIGYKFNRIEINPKGSKYVLENKGTIKIYYEKLDDVIEQKPGVTKPDGYVQVTFKLTDKSVDKADKIFWVNPTKDVTIPVKDPVAEKYYVFKEWKMGADAKGHKYNPNTPKKFKDPETIITATYQEAKNIIPYDPSLPDPLARPDGYIRVTFEADTGLKLTESKAYYVKKNAVDDNKNPITLEDLATPAYREEKGYAFEKWDPAKTTQIGETDIVVTAKAIKLGAVIPEKDSTGKLNDKPVGYKDVVFVVKEEDKAKGSLDGVTKFYVNPTEYVVLNPPATMPEAGYEFGAWDKDPRIPRVYSEDTTISGSFNEAGKVTVDPNKKGPNDITITFKIDGQGGKIADGAASVYYVAPNNKVSLNPPAVTSDTGYIFDKWTPDPTQKTEYSENKEIIGTFKPLDPIIPKEGDNGVINAKPSGYITVTFLKGEHGKDIDGKTVYYVNPNAGKTIGDLAKPTVTPDIGYIQKTFVDGTENRPQWNLADGHKIAGTDDITVTPVYEDLRDVIPKEENGKVNAQPSGYITVKFSTETNGKIKDTDKTEKVLYVNSKKAVVLDGFKPEVTPNTGYEFASWNRPIKDKVQYDDGDVIQAQYNEIGNVLKTQKPGYIEVEFIAGDQGSLEGDKTLWVKPGVEVNIPAPDVKPNVGYKFDKWDKDLKVRLAADAKKYVLKAVYTKLEDIIAQENADGSDRPDGYIAVTFSKGDHGKEITGQTVYYVNPNADKKLADIKNKPTAKPEVGYKFTKWDKEDTTELKNEITVKALYEAIPDVVKEEVGVTKPDGYVTVKVVPTKNAVDETEKTFFVNPTKEVKIPFAKPVGKKIPVGQDNPKAFEWIFKKWTSDETPFRTWDKDFDDGFSAKFTNDTTTITANYEKSITDQGSVIADEITVHESYKDGNTWVNNFLPKEEDLKKALKVKGVAVPNNATVTFLKDDGQAYADEAAFKTALYDKLGEKANTNDEPTRVEHVKAQVKFANGEVQTVEIPIKVLKNIYEAKTNEGKPSYVPDGYVKVTVDPTTKAKDPQKHFYYVNPDAKVVISGTDPEGTEGNKFIKWTMPGTQDTVEFKFGERYPFSGATTITAQYVSDVIPQDGDTKPTYVPNNFVSVTFDPTTNGTLEGAKVFWVNPDKEVTIPVKDPVGNKGYTFKEWKIGIKPYNPGDKKQFANPTTVKANYDKANNIIPYDPDSPITRPDGYVRVKFEAEKGLELSNVKFYYVRKNAKDAQDLPITLGDSALAKPFVKAETGYNFVKWDKEDTTEIKEEDIVVTAIASKLGSVIPEKDGNGHDNVKPEGYKDVTFVIKQGDEAKGSILGVAKYYVNPKEYVKFDPPETKANDGFEFGAWDKDSRIPTTYKEDTTITGSFNQKGDVKTKEEDKKAGDKTVTFVIEGQGGKIAPGATYVYYVTPGKEVSLNPPKLEVETGYVFDKWEPDAAKATKYDKDTIIKGSFKKLDNVVDGSQAKPDGYVTVTFVKGTNGKSITGQTVYYVNPDAKTPIKLGDTNIKKPTVVPETGYIQDGTVGKPKWDPDDTKEIKADMIVKPVFKVLEDAVPKFNDDGTENVKPDGYIEVTFSTEANGKIDDKKGAIQVKDPTKKVIYVNPKKAVALESLKPDVMANTGFEFAGWDTQIDKKIQYSDGDTIKALYNTKGDVIAQEKTDGTDKPAGYVTVTFDKGDHGKLSGKTVYYVNPNKPVTVPAPTVTPDTGWKQKDGDNAWNGKLTQQFAKDTTIKAMYEQFQDIIPGDQTKPDGYVTVTFNNGGHGTLKGTTSYHVNPEAKPTKKLSDITKPEVKPLTGYKFTGWDTEDTTEITKDKTVTAKYYAYPDVVEDKAGATRPDGYVKVTFDTTDKGSIKGTTETKKSVFVNPDKPVVLKGHEPEVEGKGGYKFLSWDSNLARRTYYEEGDTIKALYESPSSPCLPGGNGGNNNDTDEPGEGDKKPGDNGRIGGGDRIDTAVEISKQYYKKAKTVIVARSDDFPDALTASVLAKALDSPILLTRPGQLSESVKAEIKRLGANKIYIIGKENAVSYGVEKELRGLGSVKRLGGLDRFETSTMVAKEVVSIVGNKYTAVIATGMNFADALSISPFAAKNGYPILLVGPKKVPAVVKKTLNGFGTKDVYIAGGHMAVSRNLEKELPSLVERIGGSDRYETSAMIAGNFFGKSKKAFMASGQVFADALVIGPVAARINAPVLLTSKEKLPKAMKSHIDKAHYKDIVLIGLKNAISKAVEAAIR